MRPRNMLFSSSLDTYLLLLLLLPQFLGKNQKGAIGLNSCYMSSMFMTSRNSPANVFSHPSLRIYRFTQKPKTPQLSVKDHILRILASPSPFFPIQHAKTERCEPSYSLLVVRPCVPLCPRLHGKAYKFLSWQTKFFPLAE